MSFELICLTSQLINDEMISLLPHLGMPVRSTEKHVVESSINGGSIYHFSHIQIDT
ncbi:hypothetical protein Ac2012v2_006286, partial [Leucoagaricus gongylophorus]